MKTIEEMGLIFKENPKAIYTTISGLVIGACFGVIAFFYGWLG